MNWHEEPQLDLSSTVSDILSGLSQLDDEYEVLTAASEIASLTQQHGTYLGSRPAAPEISEVEEVLFRDGTPEADVVLLTLDGLVNAPLLTESRRRLIERRTRVPKWMGHLGDTKAIRAVRVGPVTRELQTVMIEVKASGGPLTVVVEVLYSGTAMINDAYVSPGPLTDLVVSVESNEGDSFAVERITLADARAEVEEDLKYTGMYLDAPETDTWPDCKPLLQWILRMLPQGGIGHEYGEYSEEELDVEVAGFMASPYAAGLGKRAANQAGLLLNLASNYGTGDPRNWSAQLATRLMTDLLPRKVMAGADYMRPIPRVIEALTRYYHDKFGVPEVLTAEVVDAIRASKRGYSRAIRPDFHDSAFYDVAGFGWDWEMDIGGSAVLDEVDAEPLPTEKFRSKGLPQKVSRPARAVAREIERVAPDFFDDPELITSALRALRKLCEDFPEYFTSKSTGSKPGKPLWETSVAASICWLVGKGNNWFNRSDPDTTVKALTSAFGLKSSPGSRGDTLGSRMLSAQRGENRWHLGDPALLTSARRRNVLHEAKTSEDDPWLRL